MLERPRCSNEIRHSGKDLHYNYQSTFVPSPIAWERVLEFRNNTDLAFEHVTKWRGEPQDDKHFATGEDFRLVS